MKAFETFVEGFKMSFENGFTISVQFSNHHWCDGSQTTAEVTIWDAYYHWHIDEEDGNWLKPCSYGLVMHYQTAEQVANLIQLTRIKEKSRRGRKKKELEYQDIEYLQWLLDNVYVVGAFDSERTMDKIDAMKLKLIAIRGQMEYEKSK